MYKKDLFDHWVIAFRRGEGINHFNWFVIRLWGSGLRASF